MGMDYGTERRNVKKTAGEGFVQEMEPTDLEISSDYNSDNNAHDE
jgi:hypothetical protein